MGKKFSFNLAPHKAPSKPEDHPAPSHAPEKPLHRRHHSKDSVSSPNMSYISRQRIDPQTEQELRAACALILENFKPSDHDIPDADPKLDFHGPHRRREQKTEASYVRVHKPTGAPVEHKTSHDTRKIVDASKSYPEQPLRANTGRRRAENTQATDAETDPRRPIRSHTADTPRYVLARADSDPDEVLSVGTPHTTSTETHMYNASTAPTSVAVTHRSSKRTSRQDAAAIADAQATEWMRQELEKRRQQMSAQQSRPQTSEQQLSRSTSIRSGLRDYIFPGSRGLSRSHSRESMRSQSSSQQKRNSSSQGWRSWGLNRMSSSRNSSRPASSGGRTDRVEQDKKGDLDLNRKLPPLPSLDTWKDPELPKQKSKAPAQGAHIATLMRTDDQQQSHTAGVRQQHRRSGSDTMALRYAHGHSPAPPCVKSPTLQAFAQKSTALVPEDRSMDFNHIVSVLSPTRNMDDKLKLRVSGRPGHASMASRASSDSRTPNFSRKISTDELPFDKPWDVNAFVYPNVVQITALNAPKPSDQKSTLKRVLSSWMIKKEKKQDDWMHKFEKEGIRTGVMLQDEAALPPVVRY